MFPQANESSASLAASAASAAAAKKLAVTPAAMGHPWVKAEPRQEVVSSAGPLQYILPMQHQSSTNFIWLCRSTGSQGACKRMRQRKVANQMVIMMMKMVHITVTS